MIYYYNNLLIIGDNEYLLEMVYKILNEKQIDKNINIVFAHSPQTVISSAMLAGIHTIDIRQNISNYNFDLIISLHCKQIFPSELVRRIKCINIHPGFNPYNRGWYPHVFSIINKLPAGITIHEMDEKIDHGPIIVQQELYISSHDTSETLYSKILDEEIKLFSKYIENILRNDYETYLLNSEGNINYKEDYEKLKQIDIQKMYKGDEFIDLIRALTHDKYKNAFFVDRNNNKIFIRIILEEG